MNMPRFRVLIIDDSDHAREGIRMILSSDPVFEVVAEGRSGNEALALTEQWMPIALNQLPAPPLKWGWMLFFCHWSEHIWARGSTPRLYSLNEALFVLQ